MIDITSTRQLMDSMALAKETGTEDQLIHWLLYLDSWHGKNTTLVSIAADIPSSPAFISWAAFHVKGDILSPDREVDLEPFYNGGLVFHERSKEWSINS